ncbi:hypothetical protein D3C80_1193850 [compost metagenome]
MTNKLTKLSCNDGRLRPRSNEPADAPQPFRRRHARQARPDHGPDRGDHHLPRTGGRLQPGGAPAARPGAEARRRGGGLPEQYARLFRPGLGGAALGTVFRRPVVATDPGRDRLYRPRQRGQGADRGRRPAAYAGPAVGPVGPDPVLAGRRRAGLSRLGGRGRPTACQPDRRRGRGRRDALFLGHHGAAQGHPAGIARRRRHHRHAHDHSGGQDPLRRGRG